jgi:transposase
LDKTDQGYRLVWIRGSQKQKDDRLFREAQLRRADMELADLGTKLNHRQLRTERSIRAAVNEILKRLKVENLLNVTLKQRTHLIAHHLKPGRPTPGSTLQMEKQKAWSLRIRRNQPEIARQKRTDGVFPLITNLERLPKKEILLKYKYQPYIEKRFASLKTDLEIAPVYLKKPRRVAGLIHAHFLALTVGSLIERELRNAMEKENIQALALLPERRFTKTPTCPTIMDAFSQVTWQEFQRGEERVVFPVELNVLQKKLLSMFKIPMEIYR